MTDQSAGELKTTGWDLLRAGRPDEGAAHFLEALARAPGDAEAHFSLACARQAQGDVASAAAAYEMAIRLDPDHVPARSNLGVLCLSLGQPERAVAWLRPAALRRPTDPHVLLNLGAALKAHGEVAAAVGVYRRAIAARPSWGLAHMNLGNALQALGELDAAIACHRHAVALRPDEALAHNALATALRARGQLADARAAFERAGALRPDWYQPPLYLGELALQAGNPRSAIEHLRRSSASEPRCWQAHFNLSLALLELGAFEEGWQEYEWRWGDPDSPPRPPVADAPPWRGEPLRASRVLLWAEQGLGDTIQFVRYAEPLRRAGATVWVRAPRPLVRLLATCPGVHRALAEDEDIPEGVDYQIPLMSLPRALGTTLETIPARVPYLRAGIDLGVVPELDRPGELRVGIVWAGGGRYRFNAERSCSARQFGRLARIPGVRLFSLQHGVPGRALFGEEGVDAVDLSARFGDFAQTAALVERLDLVVTVDTSVAHLAGALGRPVWTVLSHVADWRWLHDRDDCPWYPTMRLFRQPRPGDWDGAFAAVERALVSYLTASPPGIT
jgi:tetratricopeptide (TPR) repeat protein